MTRSPIPIQQNYQLVCELYQEAKKLEQTSKTEVCSSICYEYKMLFKGYRQAIAFVCNKLGEQNPFDRVPCKHCKEQFTIADLELTGGYCYDCQVELGI